MPKPPLSVPDILNQLESFYGPQQPGWPTDPYLFVVWWHCGYPASDKACAKGWDSLNREIGVNPDQLLSASPHHLAIALKPGGMVPELRAMRLKEIAARVKDEFAGDLRSALIGPLADARKKLKKFPNIADPGADRILLFAGIAPFGGRAFQLSACAGQDVVWQGTGELWCHLSRGAGDNRSRGDRHV